MKKLAINSHYEKPKIVAGDLNIPVKFFEYKPVDGPEPGEQQKKELYKCTCLTYKPSMKDMDILRSKETEEGTTIKIRDPYKDYIPTNKHKVEIDDYRMIDSGVLKVWEIIDVAPDYEDSNFIKIVLKRHS